MKVKDLVKLLQSKNQNLEVLIQIEREAYRVEFEVTRLAGSNGDTGRVLIMVENQRQPMTINV